MITENDSLNTFEGKKDYVILPSHDQVRRNFYLKNKDYKPVKKGFSYDSKNNDTFLSISELKEIVSLFEK